MARLVRKALLVHLCLNPALIRVYKTISSIDNQKKKIIIKERKKQKKDIYRYKKGETNDRLLFSKLYETQFCIRNVFLFLTKKKRLLSRNPNPIYELFNNLNIIIDIF